TPPDRESMGWRPNRESFQLLARIGRKDVRLRWQGAERHHYGRFHREPCGNRFVKSWILRHQRRCERRARKPPDCRWWTGVSVAVEFLFRSLHSRTRNLYGPKDRAGDG